MSPDASPRVPAPLVALLAALAVASWVVTGAVFPGLADEPPTVPVVVEAVDEDGDPVEGTVEVLGRSHAVGAPIEVSDPVLGFVTADGFLDEPVVLSPGDPDPVVHLVAGTGPDGDRRVLHVGGDTMVGRRYVDAGAGGGVDDDGDAIDVVDDLAPLFAAADLSMLNLESVAGDLGTAEPYPGKRFLVHTPDHGLAALDALGIDLVTLGNNHARDWGDEGLAATIEALLERGIATTGAGVTEAAARAPALVDLDGLTVAVVSVTSVTGDVVNDALPTGTDARPGDVAPGDAWQYEERAVPAAGPPFDEPMRAGDAWRAWEALEGDLDDDPLADLWVKLTGPDAFPELQDWVARRGHGGAAHFRPDDAAADIEAARAAGADIVVAHLHGGFQYAPVASAYAAGAMRGLAEAGADVVVGHHPHVLQGVEVHAGVPIVHSLGNLVFDQDFEATFPSAVLRVVVDPGGVVSTRLYPIELVGHRPVPVGGVAADDAADRLAARSVGGVVADRLPDQTVGVVRGDGFTGASLRPVGWGWEVVDGGDAATPTAACNLLIRGSFEDHEADGEVDGGAHWSLSDGAKTVFTAEATDGTGVLRFDDDGLAWARPVSRVPVPAHRLFDESGSPIDGPRSLAVHLDVRGHGVEAYVRFDAYRFDDSDPTRDPQSERLSSVEVPLDVPGDGTWRRVEVPVPAEALPEEANSLLPYVFFRGLGDDWLEVDGVALVETREGGTACWG